MPTSSHLSGIVRNGLAWQLLQAMPDASFLVDRKSLTILATNQAAEELTGQRGDSLLNQSLSEFFTSPAVGDLSADLLSAVAPLGGSSRLVLCRKADADQLQLLEASSRSLESDGQPLTLITVRPPASTSDEDLRVQEQERELSYASEQFRYLFEHSPDAIFVETPDGIVLDANQAACELHRISRDELIGKNVLSLVPPEDRPVVSVRSDALATGAISEFESRSLRSDGEAIPIGVRISTITYNGNPAVLLHVRDITQQKRDEIRKREHDRQLAHVSRLTMMGQLVAGIAHELRQPLWSLSTFADVCVESLSRPDFAERLPKIREVADKVVSEARRANAITTRMFAFARNGVPERTTCDIAAIARDAMELTAGRARASRIRTIFHPDRNLPFVNCDRVLIEQTFANLLNNAYTALAVHPSDNREVTVEISYDEDEQEYVTVMLRDNGPGLPENVVAEQLFEDFFTTGQAGLGIGLALCRSFVEDHGGVIWAEQLPAGGMEFVFTLRVDGGRHPNAN
jgi:PAS domain S-box-containing protein